MLLLTLGRTQFSVEKPKTVTTLMPYLEQSLTNSLILFAPALSPSSIVNPLSLAHLLCPSGNKATCFGISSGRRPAGSLISGNPLSLFEAADIALLNLPYFLGAFAIEEDGLYLKEEIVLGRHKDCIFSF